MTDAEKIVNALIETDEEFDMKDAYGEPPMEMETSLRAVLDKFGITDDRLATHESDVYVLCPTYQEARQIVTAGKWRSLAMVVPTNKDHPDAKQYPWLADIPFARLGALVREKRKPI